MDYEEIKEIGETIRDFIKELGKIITEIAEKIGEIIAEVVETLNNYKEKPKYKLVKSLIKPYKQPFIKIRARARANL